ncbi:MAG: hypothetical protein HYX94_08530 [Chloroflexi bacterium]|nr:hypothetical protein [Chloroflexota bacterium]
MKKAPAILFSLLLVSVIVLSTISCGSDKTSLQLRLSKGKTYTMRMVTEQQISQKIQGNDVDISQTIGLGYAFEASEVDKQGSSSVNVTYDWALFKQKSPLGSLEYDSDKRPKVVPPAAQGFAALIGQGFAMKLASNGMVNDIQGIDDMLARMIENLSSVPGLDRAALEKGLKEQFGDEAMKESMQNALSIYPDKPVKIGDAWTRRITLTRGYPMVSDNTWKLTGRKGGVASIAVSSQVESLASSGTGGAAVFKLSGTQEGTIELEEATGWIRRSKMSQRLSGQVETGPQSWPISMESTISFEGSVK